MPSPRTRRGAGRPNQSPTAIHRFWRYCTQHHQPATTTEQYSPPLIALLAYACRGWSWVVVGGGSGGLVVDGWWMVMGDGWGVMGDGWWVRDGCGWQVVGDGRWKVQGWWAGWWGGKLHFLAPSPPSSRKYKLHIGVPPEKPGLRGWGLRFFMIFPCVPWIDFNIFYHSAQRAG